MSSEFKRGIKIFYLAILMIFILTACGKNTDENAPSSQGPTNPPQINEPTSPPPA